MADVLVVNEVYLSAQGESTFAGLPCVFVRLTGCNLRCSYCDSAYAFKEGSRMSHEAILAEVARLASPYGLSTAGTRLPLVEFTGGEPLLQSGTFELMTRLCDLGFTVLVETSGAIDISQVDPRVRRIMDLKCPASGESHRNRLENLPLLRSTDEVKLVISSLEDYVWAKRAVTQWKLAEVCPVLFSWASPLAAGQHDPSLKPLPAGHTPVTRRELVERILADALPVRFQLQMHKFIWAPETRGV